MKEIWSALKLYDYLLKHNFAVPSVALCTKDFLWKDLLVNQVEMPQKAVLESLFKVASLLQSYKEKVFKNSPVKITSGWRSVKYNRKIGGAANSLHIQGKAIDFVVQSYPPHAVQTLLDPIHAGGLEFAKTWTHIDIRGYKIRFDQSGKVVKG